ncbi:hypothetical protein [Bacillus sp. RC252]|uniref:hypothetical protein n=1 Tax=Bacillus sp. RC252 TaxID=3156289 RepID=UPI00383499E5
MNQSECESIQLFPELRDTKKINDYKYLQIRREIEHSLDIEQREMIERKYLKSGVMSDKAIKA